MLWKGQRRALASKSQLHGQGCPPRHSPLLTSAFGTAEWKMAHLAPVLNSARGLCVSNENLPCTQKKPVPLQGGQRLSGHAALAASLTFPTCAQRWLEHFAFPKESWLTDGEQKSARCLATSHCVLRAKSGGDWSPAQRGPFFPPPPGTARQKDSGEAFCTTHTFLEHTEGWCTVPGDTAIPGQCVA